LKEGEEITDKHIKRRSDVDKASNLGAIALAIFIMAGAVSLPMLYVLYYNYDKAMEDPFWIFIFPSIAIISLLIRIYAQKTNLPKYNIFDRENGRISLYGGWPTKTWFELDWDNCEGELLFKVGRYGRSEYFLRLKDKNDPEKGFWLTQDILDPENALRYWSFLVQYMDKTQPLPDTINFEQYPNRTKGLWGEAEWEKLRWVINDPYKEWLNEQMEAEKEKEYEEMRSKGRFADTGRG
jgi:hypothetical protein